MASAGKNVTNGKRGKTANRKSGKAVKPIASAGKNVTNGEHGKNVTESIGRFPFDQKIPV